MDLLKNQLLRIQKTQDLHQSQMYAQTMSDMGWRVYGSENTYIFARRFGPIQLIKMQRANFPDWGLLRSIRNERFTMLIHLDQGLGAEIDPPKGFQKTEQHIGHTSTGMIDLRPSLPHIQATFNQETRRNIEKGLNNELRYETLKFSETTPSQKKKIQDLQNSWKAHRPHRDTHIPGFIDGITKNSENTGRYFLAIDQKDQVQAMIQYLETVDLGVYFLACSSEKANKLKAPSALIWNAIAYAKTQKKVFFDFYGLFDDRAPKVYQYWRGFSEFKMRFHPIVVNYPLPLRLYPWNRL